MIAILVPSRGRPERAALMASTAVNSSESADVHILVDQDDPEVPRYQAIANGRTIVHVDQRMGYTGSLNWWASQLRDSHAILGAFGDDVVFRTDGWDKIVERTLETPGIAYGDDLIHGKNHPSAVFMSSGIAKALGWLALPATTHQWADDGWKRLGTELGILRFMPDVIVEHMHPAVGKAEWDATYAGVFDDERAKRDFDGFTYWAQEGGLLRDVERVRHYLETGDFPPAPDFGDPVYGVGGSAMPRIE